MGKYRLMVFTDPVPGREDEYNEWYNDVHLPDVVAVPGIASAQRLKIKTLRAGTFPNRYLAIYDFESDDPDAVIQEISKRSRTPKMLISDALDSSGNNVAIFEICSAVVTPMRGDD